ncbi:protein SCAI [Entophlyctis helioformis]|nr:protein SCAI [Entophlyctis helioformis]
MDEAISAHTAHSETFTDSGQPAAAAAAAAAPPSNAKIVEEFQYLLEKSQQLFAGLRDLPPTGRNWQPYFQRTFEVYTKIWKFQQTYRAVLDNKEYYGLKRWEIGELASKIGQLYYHYYLRTSETNYLYESFIFYEAIRDRMYFKDVLEAKNAPLMIKKLRYYARFIVVCLLLNRTEMVKTLMDDLAGLVEEYTSTFRPNDSAEWNVVLSEISTFMEAERKLAPVDYASNIVHFPTRLQIQSTLKFDKDGLPKLKLQEAILVGNYANQIKFSELTLDMYRMLQSLEREPSALPNQLKPAVPQGDPLTSTESRDGIDDADKSTATRRTNPHKYLLYRPTFAQLSLYIATAFKDISENSALLMYLSADGAKRASKTDQTESYTGGVATAVNYTRKPTDKVDPDQHILTHTLHPHDLVPFTRKPMFVIVDSNNSAAFKNFPKVFNQAFVCLMSPTEYPTSIKDTTQIGGLFTMFLHAPVKGFAFVCDLWQLGPDVWSQCVFHTDATEKLIAELIEKDTSIDKSYKRFAQDDFLRNFIVRYILCHAILSNHTAFKDPKHLPAAYPPLPQSILAAPELTAKIQELVQIVNIGSLYSFGETAAPAGEPAA